MSRQSRSMATPPSLHRHHEENHRILVVDDNEAIHKDFRKILEAESEADFDAEEAAVFGGNVRQSPGIEFEVDYAFQGARALEMVQEASHSGKRYAVVFMDVRMPPGWDGLTTATKLWEVDPDLQLVICTAYSDKSWEEMMETFTNPERALILKKPFDPVEVLQLAYSLTEKWSLLQTSRRSLADLENAVRLRTAELRTANTQLEAETAAHKAAAERVREQAMLLEKARDAIVVRDLDGRVRFWNQGAERTYGWTAAEAIGQKLVGLLHNGAENDAILTACNAAFERGEWNGEITQKARDGRTVVAECRLTLVRDDRGNPTSVLCISTDVTEKKRLEANLLRVQRIDSIGTLAGGMAHDLNNILHPITLALDFLRTQLPETANKTMLDLVVTNADRAASLVRQVLCFARGVEGEHIALEANALIHEAASIMLATFPKTIQLLSIPNREAWPLSGDPTQLHQVLINLCVNARDAMPDGGTLELAVENREIDALEAATQVDAKPGKYITFSVTDSGTGIPDAVREKIFDPFFTTKEQGKGTGLGLATALGIVRSHGGFINFDSEEGKGTTFRVYLPAAEHVAAPGNHQDGNKVDDLSGHGELLLIVDDEGPILGVLCHALERHGYRVLRGNDGVDGLKAYAEHKAQIEAVITDINMPIMGGVPLVRALQKINPHVKVIAGTGMASKANVEAMRELGVIHIMAKPYTTEAVLRILREVLTAPATSPAAA